MKKYAPAGIPLKQEIGFWLGLMVFGTLWCLQYIFRYLQGRESLYQISSYTIQGIQGKTQVLIDGVKMIPFEELTNGLFGSFYLVIVFCVVVAAYHYYYHYQGSRMMYLMRRLPNKWEVHIRCLALPIAGSLMAVLYAVLLKTVFYAIYIFCTPSQCL